MNHISFVNGLGGFASEFGEFHHSLPIHTAQAPDISQTIIRSFMPPESYNSVPDSRRNEPSDKCGHPETFQITPSSHFFRVNDSSYERRRFHFQTDPPQNPIHSMRGKDSAWPIFRAEVQFAQIVVFVRLSKSPNCKMTQSWILMMFGSMAGLERDAE